MYIAQINIAKMKEPLDSPVMADFVGNLDRINALAAESPGFVWRFVEAENEGAEEVFDSRFYVVNMSVWENVDTLMDYVYKSAHKEIFRRREEWFDAMEEMHMALWYVEPGKFPTEKEAEARLGHLRKHGPTPFAFSFKKQFSAQEWQDFQKETEGKN